MRRQPKVAQAVVLAVGILTVVASFLPFVEVGGRSFTAWASEPYLFPLSTLPALLALLGVGVTAAPLVWARFPERPAGFEPDQLTAAAAASAALLMLAWLAVDKGGVGLATGAVLMLVGSGAMAAAAVAGLLGQWSGPVGGGPRKPTLRVIRGHEDQSDESPG